MQEPWVILPGNRTLVIGTLERYRSWRTLWRWREVPNTVQIDMSRHGDSWIDIAVRLRFCDAGMTIDYIAGIAPRSGTFSADSEPGAMWTPGALLDIDNTAGVANTRHP